MELHFIRAAMILCLNLLILSGTNAQKVDRDEVNELLKHTQEIVKTDPDLALKLTKSAHELAQRANSDSLLFRTNASFAEIYFQTGNYYLAIDYFLKLLPTLENIPQSKMTQRQWINLFVVYDKLANSYFALGMHAFAQQYFSQNLELVENSEMDQPALFDEFDKVSILFNLGAIYLAQDNLEQAKEVYDEVQRINTTLNDSIIQMYLYNNMGIYFNKLDDKNMAFKNFNEALTIAKAIQDYDLIAKLYNNLGQYYNETGNQTIAAESYQNAIDYGRNASDWGSVVLAANNLSTIHADRNEFEAAYENKHYASKLNDSIFNKEKSGEYARLSLQYDFDKALRLAQIEHAYQAQRQRNQKVMFALISLALLLLLVSGVFISRRKNKLLHINQKLLALQTKQALSEKEEINNRLETNQRQMTEKAMAMVQKNEFIAKIAKELYFVSQELDPEQNHKLQRLIYEMQNSRDEQMWKEFETRFIDVHNDFYNALNKSFPELTPGEKKLAAFLRLNMSSKDIAAITMQSPDSIKVARGRLRKKLGLTPDDNLIAFLEGLQFNHKS